MFFKRLVWLIKNYNAVRQRDKQIGKIIQIKVGFVACISVVNLTTRVVLIQTDRQSDSKRIRQRDNQTVRESDRETIRQTDNQTVRESDRETIRQ
jgi:hypothetical protein